MNTRQIGMVGERSAVSFLKSRGYKIINTNWFCYAGEIDIVVYKDRLTFVEVKSALSGFCSPCEMLSYRKKKNLLRSIKKYLLVNFPDNDKIPDWQLDLICIYKQDRKVRISHYENIN